MMSAVRKKQSRNPRKMNVADPLRYLALKQPDNITQCMYVWIDGTGEYLRAKTKTVKFVPKKPAGE